MATGKLRDYLFYPKEVEQEDLSEFRNMDVVLDTILATQSEESTIRSITQTDTYDQEDKSGLTAKEQEEIEMLIADNIMQRTNPVAYGDMIKKREAAERGKPRQPQFQQRNTDRQVRLPSTQYNMIEHSATRATANTPLSSALDESTSSGVSVNKTIRRKLRDVLDEKKKSLDSTRYPDVGNSDIEKVAWDTMQAFVDRKVRQGRTKGTEATINAGIKVLENSPPLCHKLITASNVEVFREFAHSIPWADSGLSGVQPRSDPGAKIRKRGAARQEISDDPESSTRQKNREQDTIIDLTVDDE